MAAEEIRKEDFLRCKAGVKRDLCKQNLYVLQEAKVHEQTLKSSFEIGCPSEGHHSENGSSRASQQSGSAVQEHGEVVRVRYIIIRDLVLVAAHATRVVEHLAQRVQSGNFALHVAVRPRSSAEVRRVRNVVHVSELIE